MKKKKYFFFKLKDKIHTLLGTLKKEGGKFLLDGRNVQVYGYPKGNFIGPTVMEVDTSMSCWKEEIFGPALSVIYVNTLQEAIDLVNR